MWSVLYFIFPFIGLFAAAHDLNLEWVIVKVCQVSPEKSHFVWSVLHFIFPFIGLFAAAHDLNLEWMIVKGISHFSDDGNTPNESWKSFASIMAASLVSNMLNDPVIFKDWPHYEGISHPCSDILLIMTNFLFR